MNGNGRPTRLDEAAKAVRVAQRCGTVRRPACHAPLPARQGYHMNITFNCNCVLMDQADSRSID